MSGARWSLIAIAGAAAALGIWITLRHASAPEPQAAAPSTVDKPKVEAPSFAALAVMPIKAKKIGVSPPPSEATPRERACLRLTDDAATRPFGDFFLDLQRGIYDEALTISECPGKLDEFAALRSRCSTETSRNANDCRRLAQEWRAAMLDYTTRDIPIAEIEDLTVLTNKFVRLARRIFEQGHPDELGTLRSLTERMRQLAPDNPDVVRLSVWGLATEPDAFSDDLKWHEMESRIEQMQTSNVPRSLAHDEFALAMRSGRERERLARDPGYDFGDFRPELQAFREAHPRSGFSFYIEASLEYRRGRREQALALTAKALEMEPAREEFTRTDAALQTLSPSDPLKEGLFSIGFKVPLDFSENK